MHQSEVLVPDLSSAIIELVPTGMTTGEIATRLGITRRTVQRHRKAIDASVPQGRPPKVEPNEVTRLTNKGISVPKIAKHLGVTDRTIQNHRKKNSDVIPEETGGGMRERPLNGYVTPLHNFKDRRAERIILLEILEKDKGLVRMFYDTHTTSAIAEERANALASFSNGTFQKRLMSQNGQTLKMLGRKHGSVKIKVFAEQRPELNPIFAIEGITPIRTSIENDAEYVVTHSELHRLRTTQLTNSGNNTP
ncbi:MAG: hypothetical protein DDT32_00497 [Syntrophomonadaceae bacterium]|nr:hypothetical protein [Bacillota bacterium]